MLGVNFVPRAFSWLEGALVVSADCHWYGSCPSNCSHRSPSWCCGYWQRLSEGINCNILKHVKIALTLLQATSSSLCSPCPYGSPLGSSKVHVSCQGSPSRTVVPLKFPLITYPFSSTDKSFSPPRAILVAKNHVLEVYSLYPLGMCVRRHLSSSPDFSTPSTLTLYVYGHGSRTHLPRTFACSHRISGLESWSTPLRCILLFLWQFWASSPFFKSSSGDIFLLTSGMRLSFKFVTCLNGRMLSSL